MIHNFVASRRTRWCAGSVVLKLGGVFQGRFGVFRRIRGAAFFPDGVREGREETLFRVFSSPFGV